MKPVERPCTETKLPALSQLPTISKRLVSKEKPELRKTKITQKALKVIKKKIQNTKIEENPYSSLEASKTKSFKIQHRQSVFDAPKAAPEGLVFEPDMQ